MDSLGFLEANSKGSLCKKLIKSKNKIKKQIDGIPRRFEYSEFDFESLSDLASFLDNIRLEKTMCLVMGRPKRGIKNPLTRRNGKTHKSNFKDANLCWLILDIDHLPANLDDPEKVIKKRLPTSLRKTSYVAHLTSSYGLNNECSMRFFFHLDDILTLKEQAEIASILNTDKKIYQPNRLIFTADPIGNGAPKIDERIIYVEKPKEILSVETVWKDIGKPLSLDVEKNKSIQRIKECDEGDRNNTLFLEAVQLAALWFEKGRDPIELFDPLKEAALKSGLSEEEIIPTLNSALKRATTNGKKQSVKDQFYELATDSISDLVYSDQNEYFIRTSNKVIQVEDKNRSVRDWLTHLYKKDFNKIPELGDVNAVINALLSDIAQQPTSKVSRRIASDKDFHLISLNPDLDYIKIDYEGYSVLNGHPDNTFFVEMDKYGKLPKPKETEYSLFELIGSLFENLSDSQVILLCAWLLGTWEPSIKYPLLTLSGIRGSGKSTLASALKYFVDPAKGNLDSQLNPEPKSIEDLFVVVNSQHVSILDNISYLEGKYSDALAIIATGGSFKNRALWTNSDIHEQRIRKPVIITSINQVTKNSDLADRSVNINLATFKKSIDERRLFSEIQEIRPYIMHCLAESMVCSKAFYSQVDIQGVHRMSGWLRTVVAACECPLMGFTADEFFTAIGANRDLITEDMLESDSVAAEIYNLVQNKEVWKGNLKQLNDALTLPMLRIPADWPKTLNSLGRKLAMIEPDMRHIHDIHIAKCRSSVGRYWAVTNSYDNLIKLQKASKKPLVTPKNRRKDA